MNIQTVKGFKDFVGDEALKREKIKKIIQEQFELYGFEPAETPIIEFEEFVKSDNPNDEAVRDVFKLEDRGKRKLALRYEFTFQLKRISKNQKLPYKRYQIGYNFRDEPIKKGRLRQFIQCDADVVGSGVKDEVECLKLGKNIFEKLNMPVKIYVNNRKLINEILVTEKIEEKNRDQVIRELDKLDKLSRKEVADNLKKFGAEKLLKIFEQSEKEFEKYNFYKEIKELKNICKAYGFKVEFKPFLARGLSYYNGTIFEIWSKDLDVSLCGGGSYLVGDVQSTGITFGLEPISLLSKIDGDKTKIQIISIGQDNESIQLAENLRGKGISVNLLLDKSIGKAMDYANSKGIEKVIFIGKEEISKKKFRVKDMKTGKEEFLSESNVLKV
ncbi:ATP phosphoribosyltransferase regulatory subunit [Candidatus Pacearchaeota archaeon]|nr:ATP phosphoribosyltransferase regulatory subunit [Candidatus Pacearchaeota archaeon]